MPTVRRPIPTSIESMTLAPALIESAAQKLAASIVITVRELKSNKPGADIYAICLATTDDFSSLTIHANTKQHFANSNGSMLSKWYFAEWWSGGIDIDNVTLEQTLGVVNDIDETPESDNGPKWLAAMTKAMKIASNDQAFFFGDEKPYLFCSMSGDDNAVWIEHLSARYLNSDSRFALIQKELEASHKEWYFDDTGRAEYRDAYQQLLA